MSRLRIPIALIASGLALPAMGKATNVGSAELSVGPIVNIECRSLSSGQLNIEIECSIARVEVLYANAFARARNAEIDASIARVKGLRLKAFEQARNAEINASIALVAFRRARNAEINASIARVAFHRARNAEINASIAGVRAQRLKAFEQARNAEINASIALVAFHRARNAEINASIAGVKAQRHKAFEQARNAEINASIALVAFHRARNAEINASIAGVKAQRHKAFEQARNAEINASIARVAFHRARNAEINASIAGVKAQRLKAFEQARNAEINASIALVAFHRARNAEINASIALVSARRALLETGTINVSGSRQARNQVNQRTQTCAATAVLLDQVRFAKSSIEIDEDARPTLDELATLAERCPGSHIEIHGHTDASGSKQANLRLSERRAEVVAAYLVASGIDMRRLKIIAHGAAHPILPNTTPEFRARNRRIEFTIKDSTAEATAAIVVLDLAKLLDPNYALLAGWMQR
jgi:outer membrane protein OmpA-like peptidoglycan-associated protein